MIRPTGRDYFNKNNLYNLLQRKILRSKHLCFRFNLTSISESVGNSSMFFWRILDFGGADSNAENYGESFRNEVKSAVA